MTDRRLDYLAGQRQRLFCKQHGRCAHCGKQYRSHWEMELAHRVAESKVNIKVWGWERVDHEDNKGLTCRGTHDGGIDCNAALLISGLPAEALMESIKGVEDGSA